MTRYIAKKELRYAGKTIMPGEGVNPSEKDAKLLLAIGKIEAGSPAKKDTEKEDEAPKFKGGKYATKDMKAAD